MSKVGLTVICETCGLSSSILAESTLPSGMKVYDLDCGHENGWNVPLYRLEYEHFTHAAQGYLHSRVRAVAIDRLRGLQMLKEISNAAAAAKTDRVLIQYDIEKAINLDLARYLMAEVVKSYPHLRIAWVSDNPEQLPVLESSLPIAADQGATHRYFSDLADAAEWLKSSARGSIGAFELEAERRSGYLYVNVRASAVTPALAQDIHREIKKELSKARIGRLAIEAELGNTLSEPEILQVMNDFRSVMPGYRVAFVNRDVGQQPAMKFAAAVGSYAGEYWGAFDSLTAAESWLDSWE